MLNNDKNKEYNEPAREDRYKADVISQYECGRKCRICPFPGAKCAKNGTGERD